jgi:excisionase family DNA binding protein
VPTPPPACDAEADEAPAYEEVELSLTQTPGVPLHQRLALTVEEAGALLGISRDLAYELVARKELPSIRLGRRLVVPRRALEAALDRLVEAG